MSIINCLAYEYGGGIYVEGGNDVVIQDISAHGCNAKEGGAISMYGGMNYQIGDMFIRNCNASEYGGGLDLLSNVEVNISYVNIANCHSLGGSGLISMFSKHYRISNVNVTECSSLIGGGGIWLERNEFFEVDTINISKCSATKLLGYGNGAGIAVQSCHHIYISNVEVTDSISYVSGGGIHFFSCTASMLSNSKLSRNSAKQGGGVSLIDCDNFVVHDVIIDHTNASKFGGGLYAQDSENLVIERLDIFRALAEINGGGVEILYCSTSKFVDSKIRDCTARDGGAMTMFRSRDIIIESIELSNNTAQFSGGGLYLDASNNDIWVSNASITRNFAGSQGGGAFVSTDNTRVFWTSKLSLQNSKLFMAYQVQSQIEEFHFDGAIGVIVSVNASTLFDRSLDGCCASLSIYNRTNLLIYADGWLPSVPGVHSSALLVNDDYVKLEYFDTASKYVSKAVVYVIPIYPVDIGPNIIHNNVALRSGGGIMYESSNENFIMASMMLKANQAVSGKGGGVMFETSNSNSLWAYSTIVGCSAGESGGGIYIAVSHFGLEFRHLSIISNTAREYGGGLSLYYNNMFVYDDISVLGLLCHNCRFDQNSADMSGGGMFINTENSIELYQSEIVRNSAGSGKGGGIWIARKNSVTIRNVTISSNSAWMGCGGGVFLSDIENVVEIIDTTINDCKALVGGGICTLASTSLQVHGYLNLTGNRASDSGGAILYSNSALWSSTGLLTIEDNVANKGSAVFMHKVTAPTGNIGRAQFVKNRAKQGTTIYWVRSNAMPEIPVDFLGQSKFTWINNSDSYGDRISTQAVTLSVVSNQTIFDFARPIFPALVVDVLDDYGQKINSSNGLEVTLGIKSNKCRYNKRPYLSGSEIFGESVINGDVTFERLQAYCFPNGNMTLSYSLDQSPLTNIETSNESFTITTQTLLQFRGCSIGEYILDYGCATCATGTYNLKFDDIATDCLSCSKISGVKSCFGSTLELDTGYWRRHPSSHTVLQCLSEDSCQGGTSVGDDLCSPGYQGPLCGTCADAYYLSGNVCNECSGTNIVGSSQIITLIVVGTAVVMAISSFLLCGPSHYSWFQSRINTKNFSRMIRSIKKFLRAMKGKLKIIVSTFQVVTSTAGIFNVHLPSNVTRFMNGFKVLNLNVVQFVPLECIWKVNFYDRLRWATIAPLAILAIIGSCYTLESTYAHFTTSATSENDQEAALRMKRNSRYLNYVFYLSYLILPSVTTTIFQLYVCTNVDPHGEDGDTHDWFLMADVSIACYTPIYYKWTIYGILMILLYPIGIPAFYLCSLYSCKDEIQNRGCNTEAEEQLENDDAEDENEQEVDLQSSTGTNAIHVEKREANGTPQNKDIKANNPNKELTASALQLAFLWEAYKPLYWYWELVEAGRRILLTAVLSICATGSTKQFVLGIVFAYFSNKLYIYFQPYNKDSEMQLSEVGQVQIFLTFFATLVLTEDLLGPDLRDMIGGLLIGVNTAVIAVGFYGEVIAIIEENPQSFSFIGRVLILFALIKKNKVAIEPHPEANSAPPMQKQSMQSKHGSIHPDANEISIDEQNECCIRDAESTTNIKETINIDDHE